MTIHRALLVLAVATFGSACGSLPAWTTEEQATVATAEYEPVYYENRVVYFSDAGSPYYYDGPNVVWIQPTWPGYAGYVRHYHHWGPRYHVWHRSHVHVGPPVGGGVYVGPPMGGGVYVGPSPGRRVYHRGHPR